MKTYSPYDNLEKRAYPAMLVTTSLNDSQVMYWEPAKYVARLRTLKTDSNPLLLKINMDPAGHGGASGRYDRLKTSGLRIRLAAEPGRHHALEQQYSCSIRAKANLTKLRLPRGLLQFPRALASEVGYCSNYRQPCG